MGPRQCDWHSAGKGEVWARCRAGGRPRGSTRGDGGGADPGARGTAGGQQTLGARERPAWVPLGAPHTRLLRRPEPRPLARRVSVWVGAVAQAGTSRSPWVRVSGVWDLLTSQGLSLSPVSNQATVFATGRLCGQRAAAARADVALGVGRGGV